MEKYRSKEELLTIGQGGRLTIPSRTLRELELADGELVFVRLTKATVSKELLADEAESEPEKAIGGENNA